MHVRRVFTSKRKAGETLDTVPRSMVAMQADVDAEDFTLHRIRMKSVCTGIINFRCRAFLLVTAMMRFDENL